MTPGAVLAPRSHCLGPLPHRRRPRAGYSHPIPLPWPGADPACGPSLYLDQLGLWDSLLLPPRSAGPPDGPLFHPAGCSVRRIPPRGSKDLIGGFLARTHYTAGPGMRGLPFGLYRGDALLGVAVFSRVCRPRWAAENFTLLPEDRGRSAVQRRHLTVTEAEYAALSRLALSPADVDGAPLGKGAASWFLCRALAGIEARNRALWAAHQRLLRGAPLSSEHLRLVREAAGADRGRGRGYVKGIATWADPFQGTIGRIYQILAMHYAGRTNRGLWRREPVGLRSGRRLSARTLAKARAPSQPGHVQAALRLAWEGAEVTIKIRTGSATQVHGAAWIREAINAPGSTEPEILGALADAWDAWRRDHAPAHAAIALRWHGRTGIRLQAFPPKHAYFTGLGSSGWYRRQTELRHRPLTERLLAEERRCGARRRDCRRDHYPAVIAPDEIRPELRVTSRGAARTANDSHDPEIL